MRLTLAALVLWAAGCGGTPNDSRSDVAAERDKLTAEDRALVDAQDRCVVAAKQRLGSMGLPVKLDIQGTPVFICCESCRKKAEADPAATLAKLERPKAKE